jgi:hypothetical protein
MQSASGWAIITKQAIEFELVRQQKGAGISRAFGFSMSQA